MSCPVHFQLGFLEGFLFLSQDVRISFIIVSVFKISVEWSICMGRAWWEEAKLTLKEKTNQEM